MTVLRRRAGVVVVGGGEGAVRIGHRGRQPARHRAPSCRVAERVGDRQREAVQRAAALGDVAPASVRVVCRTLRRCRSSPRRCASGEPVGERFAGAADAAAGGVAPAAHACVLLRMRPTGHRCRWSSSAARRRCPSSATAHAGDADRRRRGECWSTAARWSTWRPRCRRRPSQRPLRCAHSFTSTGSLVATTAGVALAALLLVEVAERWLAGGEPVVTRAGAERDVPVGAARGRRVERHVVVEHQLQRRCRAASRGRSSPARAVARCRSTASCSPRCRSCRTCWPSTETRVLLVSPASSTGKTQLPVMHRRLIVRRQLLVVGRAVGRAAAGRAGGGGRSSTTSSWRARARTCRPTAARAPTSSCRSCRWRKL